MTIKEKMNVFKKDFNIDFENEIKKILKEQRDFHDTTTALDIPLRDFVLEYIRGGKRIRPFLINFFAKEPNETTRRIGLAVELFHLAALIHDDIMDQSEVRRGVPTMHIATGHFAQENKHLGTDIALLLGDIFLTESIAIASELPKELFQEFRRMIARTIRGQYLDSFGMNQILGETPTEEILARHELKTAWYTFSSPARLGYMSQNNYDNQTLDTLSQLTRELGLLFQIRDDIIDCIDATSGKKLFGDILENQTTWVTLYIKKNYPEKFKEILSAKQSYNIALLKIIFEDIDLLTPYQKEFNKRQEMIKNAKDIDKDIQQKAAKVLNLLTL